MDCATSILVIMGVSGCGKSTMAEGLHKKLGWVFQEGDALHPAANVAKMSAGIPLDDSDRAPWLASCARWIANLHARGEPGILTCSALKRAYRDTLSQGLPEVWFVYLEVPEAIIAERLAHRTNHYMPSSLLASQLRTLEVPGGDEQVIRVAANGDIDQAEQAVIDALPRG
ncbi:gluconokinase [Acetobacteraceae bacterium KSS8]|uniref:Gluconokinase n=1 Tax=Endosaccharibacter trunci TaxID=2812733 RepID=A0ABT1W430_9PROT|nr:gluconokinase [Acetobacteraceae bacterium KSS8]